MGNDGSDRACQLGARASLRERRQTGKPGRARGEIFDGRRDADTVGRDGGGWARGREGRRDAAIAIVRSGGRCEHARREVAPASDRVERDVVAVAVAPSARVALGKDELSRLFTHLNKCPFST